MADVAEAIVNQLAKAPNTTLTVTIEVEADTAEGFDENIQRTVSENATVLHFDTSDFENG